MTQTPLSTYPHRESKLAAVVQRCRVVISVGAGGVGKTSTAAAVGLLGASLGRRTLVMTIDPARRLATSLGLGGGLDHREREVPADKMRLAGLQPGLLHAMMLDQKQAFDDVVWSQSPDEASARRVLANKIYQELSTRLAGGQEYAAMEKLYELSQAGTYDLLVLDTPPTANALDFFDAPHKMVDLVDSPAIGLFIKSYRKAGHFSLRILTAGARLVFRRLSRLVGSGFLDELAQFFAAMQFLLDGFKERAAKVIDLLSRADVGYLIVTTPDRRAVDEAIGFYERFGRPAGQPATSRHDEVSPSAPQPDRPLTFVINRLLPVQAVDLSIEQAASRLVAVGVRPAGSKALAADLLAAHEQTQVLAHADAAQIDRLVKHCGDEHTYVRVPLFSTDIHDISGLQKLAHYL